MDVCVLIWKFNAYVAVPGRNQTLFRCLLRLHYRVPSAVMQYFCCRWGSYTLCKLMNTWHIYPAHMGPTPNGSSALQRFERCNALEIRNGIIFDFYLGLPHILLLPTHVTFHRSLRLAPWCFASTLVYIYTSITRCMYSQCMLVLCTSQ